MSKKVGLAIITSTINFGTYLQAFATQTAINNLGYSTEIININSVRKDVSKARKKYFARQLLNIPEVKSYSAIVQAIVQKKINRCYHEYISRREKYFNTLHDAFFKIGPVCNSWAGLSSYCRNFSSVVVGSDQLWRPANIAGNFYTLNFVPDDVKKISYATSFGLQEIRTSQKEAATKFLNRIQFLSCREESGVRIIHSLINKEAKLVCDPTLLLTKQDWETFVTPDPIVKERYILTYLLSSNKQHREYVKKLAQMTHCKIVGVLHGAGYIKGDENFVDECPQDVGPFEFLNLIKNARYVCTDSFHGCVFATIFERDYYVFKRFSDKDKMSTNTRVINLLNRFNLTDRLVEDYKKLELSPVDYAAVNERVNCFRMESARYLQTALQE